MSSFLELPQELRIIIYSHLSQPDLVHNLRLTCTQLRDEIDETCDFKVELDDRKPNYQRLFELRVRSCKVVHFTQSPPSGHFTTIFHFPHLIKSLKMSENVSIPNFYGLIADSSRNLKELRINLTSNLLQEEEFPLSFTSFKFDRLAYFDISVSTLGTGNGTGNGVGVPFLMSAETQSVQLFFQDFLSLQIPRLSSLKIQIRCLGFSQVCRFSALSLNFIAAHSSSLKALDLDLILGHGLPSLEFRAMSEEDADTINLAQLKKVDSLTCLRLVSSSPIGVNYWIDLLEQQRILSFIEVDILPAPASTFIDLLQRNKDSLVSIEITDLTIWDAEGNCCPFDITHFQECANLQKLILDRNTSRRRVFEAAELINLFNLPDSVHELALNYFNILSDEFILFCNDRENLQTLYLTQCGSSGVYGVDGSVLERIIDMPKIQFVEISPLNFSDVEERDKLNRILEHFGYSQNHGYFQFNLAKTTRVIPMEVQAFFVMSDDDDEEEEDELLELDNID